jgi:hypothetical protein
VLQWISGHRQEGGGGRQQGHLTSCSSWTWQSCCKLHKLLHLAAQAREANSSELSLLLLSLLPSLTTLDQVLPCTGHVDAGCVANLVRGGCDPAMAAAIAAALGLAAARAAVELVAYTASLLSPPVPAWDASTVGAKGSSG